MRKKKRKVEVTSQPTDVFMFDDDLNYDAVYRMAQDEHGHSDRINVRFPQGTQGALKTLVDELPQFEGNVHIFVRTAVVVMMKHYREVLRRGGVVVGQEVEGYLRLAELDRLVQLTELQAKELGVYQTLLDTASGSPVVMGEVVEKLTHALEHMDTTFLDRGEDILEKAKRYLEDGKARDGRRKRRFSDDGDGEG